MPVLTEVGYDSDLLGGNKKNGGRGKKGDCPLCSGAWNCNPDAKGATPGAISCGSIAGRVGLEVDGYTCTQTSGKSAVSTWVPSELYRANKKEKPSEAEIQVWKDRKLAADAARATEKEAKKIPAAIVAARHDAYMALAAMAGDLSPAAMLNLMGRGCSAAQIQEWIDDAMIIPVKPGLRVAGIADVWNAKQQSGFLIIAYNMFGRAIGAQFAADKPEAGQKYIYNATKKFPAYMEDGSLPTCYYPGGNADGDVLFGEGFLKALICTSRWNQNNVSCTHGAGSHVELPKMAAKIKSSLEETNGKAILMPDGGSHANPAVLHSMEKLNQELAVEGIKMHQANWGQLHAKGKGFDPDEREVGDSIQNYAEPFKMELGMKVEVRNGQIVATQPATKIQEVRVVGGEILKNAVENKTFIKLSDRATRGAIFCPHGLSDVKWLNWELSRSEGLKSRNLLTFPSKWWNPETEWLRKAKHLKVDFGATQNTVSRLYQAYDKSKLGVVLAEGGEYLGQCPNVLSIVERIAAGESVAFGVLAGMGCGKTELLKMVANATERSLITASNNALVRSIHAAIGGVMHTDIGTKRVDRLTCAPPTLAEGNYTKGADFGGRTFAEQFLTKGSSLQMDEIDSILMMLTHSEIASKARRKTLDTLVDYVVRAHVLGGYDARLSYEWMWLLKELRKDIIFIDMKKEKQLRKLFRYPDAATLYSSIVAKLEEALVSPEMKIAIFSDSVDPNDRQISLKVLEKLCLEIGFKREEIKLFCAETAVCTDNPSYGEDPTEAQNYRVALCSPSVNAGISITAVHAFTDVFLFGYGTIDVNALLQFTGRVRNYKNLHAWVQNAQSQRPLTLNQARNQHSAMVNEFGKILDKQYEEGIVDHELENLYGAFTGQQASVMEGENAIAIAARASIERQMISADNLATEFFGELMIDGGYEFAPLPQTPQHEIDMLKTDCKQMSTEMKDQEDQASVDATGLQERRYEQINKGGHCTTEEYRALEKFGSESITKGDVKFTNVEDLRVIRKVGGHRGIINLVRFLYESAEERIGRIKTMKSKNDPNTQYSSDKKSLKHEAIMGIALEFKAEILQLHEMSQEKSVSKFTPEFEDLANKIMNHENFKFLVRAEYKGSDERQKTKVVTGFFNFLGFEVVSKRTKKGYVYEFRIPNFTTQVIDWRIQNPEFEHKNPALNLPKISPP